MQLTFELKDEEAGLLKKLAAKRGVHFLAFAREVFAISLEDYAWSDLAEEAVERIEGANDQAPDLSMEQWVKEVRQRTLADLTLDDDALSLLDRLARRENLGVDDFAKSLFLRSLEAASRADAAAQGSPRKAMG
jgi:hypothetical protein